MTQKELIQTIFNEIERREEAVKEWAQGDEEIIDAVRDELCELRAFIASLPTEQESEDERHRKWILEYLYDGLRKSDEQFKGQFKSAIEWLEKQKEQKPLKVGENAYFDPNIEMWFIKKE